MGGAAAPTPPSLRIQSCGWTANGARLATDPPNAFLASNRISMLQTFLGGRSSVFCRLPQFTSFALRLIYRRPFVGRLTG